MLENKEAERILNVCTLLVCILPPEFVHFNTFYKISCFILKTTHLVVFVCFERNVCRFLATCMHAEFFVIIAIVTSMESNVIFSPHCRFSVFMEVYHHQYKHQIKFEQQTENKKFHMMALCVISSGQILKVFILFFILIPPSAQNQHLATLQPPRGQTNSVTQNTTYYVWLKHRPSDF